MATNQPSAFVYPYRISTPRSLLSSTLQLTPRPFPPTARLMGTLRFNSAHHKCEAGSERGSSFVKESILDTDTRRAFWLVLLLEP